MGLNSAALTLEESREDDRPHRLCIAASPDALLIGCRCSPVEFLDITKEVEHVICKNRFVKNFYFSNWITATITIPSKRRQYNIGHHHSTVYLCGIKDSQRYTNDLFCLQII